MSRQHNHVMHFFEELEMFEDKTNGHNYKAYIREAVLEFLDNQTKEKAFAVYQIFFDSYRIVLAGDTNPFIDLLDALRNYEERASTLLIKQRDHYVHSVNVFILGLCIYAQNHRFRDAFYKTNLELSVSPAAYRTRNEEFFFRWGVAALFHDSGYPVEIVFKQFAQFMEFACTIGGAQGEGEKVRPYLGFEDFHGFDSIAEILPKHVFVRDYHNQYDSCVYVDLLRPVDLLAHKIHLSLGVPMADIRTKLRGFVHEMAASGFVDHGFYSAIIVLKWYGHLIQSTGHSPDRFFHPVLDSASAILLHNYYRNVMQKHFGLGPLRAESHPIAYLLMLCDELQEWNREAYGTIDRLRTHAGECRMLIDDNRLHVTYVARKGTLPDNYSEQKMKSLAGLLNLEGVFAGGLHVDCETLDLPAGFIQQARRDVMTPRPLLENLEKLASAIHDRYLAKQLEMHPDKALEFHDYGSLPDTLKYSNLRQARAIVDRLEAIGLAMVPENAPGASIREFDTDTVEQLALIEHEEWVRERISTGWSYGQLKDVENKRTPWLVPYGDLPEEIKELDRDALLHIPTLVGMIGMKIIPRL